jgi:hypothetical protein
MRMLQAGHFSVAHFKGNVLSVVASGNIPSDTRVLRNMDQKNPNLEPDAFPPTAIQKALAACMELAMTSLTGHILPA